MIGSVNARSKRSLFTLNFEKMKEKKTRAEKLHCNLDHCQNLFYLFNVFYVCSMHMHNMHGQRLAVLHILLAIPIVNSFVLQFCWRQIRTTIHLSKSNCISAETAQIYVRYSRSEVAEYHMCGSGMPMQ